MGIEDIKKVYALFVDEKRSMQYLRELQDEYMFNEAENDVEGSSLHFLIRFYFPLNLRVYSRNPNFYTFKTLQALKKW